MTSSGFAETPLKKQRQFSRRARAGFIVNVFKIDFPYSFYLNFANGKRFGGNEKLPVPSVIASSILLHLDGYPAFPAGRDDTPITNVRYRERGRSRGGGTANAEG